MRLTLLFWLAALLVSPVLAAEKTIDQGDLAQLMVETKVVAVTDLKGPASAYKADSDPFTLEIVFLKNPEDGPNRVSDDGEVVFQRADAKDDDVQKLILDAFSRRAVKRGLAK